LTDFLSIIIPTLNESENILKTLQSLKKCHHFPNEIIVVDGGSTDDTRHLAKSLADVVLSTTAGRALQMNAGARIAQGSVLLFLHADTELPSQADSLIFNGLAQTQRHWGRFDVQLSGNSPFLRIIEKLMNTRSRISGIATGDQAIFIKRNLFEKIQGFPNIPLMEDIALSRRLKMHSPPLCLREKVRTSGRRWEKHGIFPTVLLMWCLRLAYFFGVNPHTLKKWYKNN